MGKSKCRKGKRARQQQPTVVPSVKEMTEEEEELPDLSANHSVEYALEKLSSISSEEKECGAAIIARMTDDAEFVSGLLNCDGIKIMAPLLVDRSPAVKHTVCGCLRNLSTNSEVAEEMVKQDAMTPLIALFKQYSANWVPMSSSSDKIDSKKETFVEACNLLSRLCENSQAAIEAFNNNHLMPILLPCLNLEVFAVDVLIPVAQCLHMVTENNPDAVEKIPLSTVGVLRTIIKSAPPKVSGVHLQILAAGVLLNLNMGRIDACDPSEAHDIVNVLDQVLNIPVLADIEKLSDTISCYKEEKKDKYEEPSELEEKLSSITGYLTTLHSILSAKQTALEIFANIFCSDDGDWDDNENSSTSEDLTDNEDCSSIPVDIISNIPCEIRGLIVEKKIVSKVLQQIVIPNQTIMECFQEIPEGRDCLKKLHATRCRALFSLNNIVQELTIEELSGITEVFQLWMDLAVLTFSQTDPSDVEQMEAATSSVRAVLQKLAEENSSKSFNKMTQDDLNLFFKMWENCPNSSVRVNILRSVATVACILVDMKQPNAYVFIKVIGQFLLEQCTQTQELWLTAEALDALFDVFAEDHVDYVAREIGLVEKLRLLLPPFQIKIKQQQKSLGKHLPVIMTAKTNLIRFLKYKQKSSKP